MPNKIFISYRREDTAANALGIGQYLEHQFGHKNVFIDVDMRAGAKFPVVLEQRLAECKVMLALIGQGWLNARDERGNRRLDHADDWVRLEIARALNRGITVIPVRVNGTQLPAKDALPRDIQGLLDHQAVSVTTTSFRHDMGGLARDLRAIPSAHHWRRWGAVAACVLVVLAAAAVTLKFGMLPALHGTNPPAPATARQPTTIWASKPGEWVMFAADNAPAAYFFKRSSVIVSDDKVVYTDRFPLKSASSTISSTQVAAYEEDDVVADCNKPTFANARITFYNKAGEVVSNFTRGEPLSLDLSTMGQVINPGSIISVAQHLLCDAKLRTPFFTKAQLADIKFSYLSPSPAGDGDFFHGPVVTIDSGKYQFETLFVNKLHQDTALATLFPGQNVLGLPPNYRTAASRVLVNCKDRQVEFEKNEYYDAEGNLVDVLAPVTIQPFSVKVGTPVGFLVDFACSSSLPSVGGIYEGTNTSTYKAGGVSEQKITIRVKQSGSDVDIGFETPNGGQGRGTGKLTGDTVKSITLQSTSSQCAGSFEGSLNFQGNAMSWSYEGKDCGGPMEGRGTAQRTKS